MNKFDFYFCSLACWTMHPGYSRSDTQKPTDEFLRDRAIALVKLSDALEETWDTSPQE